MTETKRTSFRFDEETLAKLDHDRGHVDRTTHLRNLIMAPRLPTPAQPSQNVAVIYDKEADEWRVRVTDPDGTVHDMGVVPTEGVTTDENGAARSVRVTPERPFPPRKKLDFVPPPDPEIILAGGERGPKREKRRVAKSAKSAKPEPCTHPVNRRLGNFCAACGDPLK